MRWWWCLILAATCWGQVDNEWDLRKLLDELDRGTSRVKPVLVQADPAKWSDRGAAANYAPQFKSAQNQIDYLRTTRIEFAKQPERLTLALETFFRLESMEQSLSSFTDGLRKYGNPAVADLLDGAVRQNSTNRNRLRQYISSLAQTKEQEFQIADQEAQRCRANLSRQPAPPPARKK